jgi:putative copper resistance protein D
MDGFGAGTDGPLTAIRAVHFAATAITAGTLIFRVVVAEPALRQNPAATTIVRSQMLLTAWIGLAVAAATGAIWLILQAAAMSGLPFGEAMTTDVLSTILNQTQFGLVTKIRFVLAIILAGCLACDRFPLTHWLAPAVALGLTAAIAWTGHAGSTPGETGILHLVADTSHLVAASAWLGGLVSLALLLATARRHQTNAWAAVARATTMRFSALGMVAVATLLLSGLVNAWILVGSFEALIGTGYGRLLTLKLCLFAVMLAFAAVNRLWLTPQLLSSAEAGPQPVSLLLLTRNSVIEIALGLAIYGIVGMLGTMHPAIHSM